LQTDEHSPLISIIIPTLNEEKLISQTLAQFTPELKDKYSIEIIISDGGSIDSTIAIACHLCDLIIEAPANIKQNISIGRNMGALQAKGKYLFFINADTLIQKPEVFFEKTIGAFNNPDILALTCNFRIFPDEEILSDKIFHTMYNNYVRLLNKLGMGMGRGECHMIRKDAFINTGGYNKSLAAGEDYDLYRQIKKIGKITFLKDLIVFESPRRYRKFGYAGVFWDWTKNSLYVLLKNKSASKTWEAVR
jgi:glycosyltransferase involved in cell wall biosynthesis